MEDPMTVVDRTSPDDRCMERLKAGEIDAVRKLFDRHNHRIFNVLLPMLGDRATAEDLTQETFLLLIEKAPTYRPEGRFPAWICKVAVRLCLMELRKRKPSRLPDGIEPESRRSGPPAEEGELRDLIDRALQAIPPKQRAAVVLRKIRGLSYRETASILGCSMGTAQSRCHYGLQGMRDWLASHGGEDYL